MKEYLEVEFLKFIIVDDNMRLFWIVAIRILSLHLRSQKLGWHLAIQWSKTILFFKLGYYAHFLFYFWSRYPLLSYL